MISIKMLGLLGLFGGLALGLVTDAPGHERPPKRRLGSLTIFDKKDYFGYVIRDGDRTTSSSFVALDFRKDEGFYPRNFEITADYMKKVDDVYLGYDLHGKNKKVLVRERSGEDTDLEWVRSEARSPFSGYWRVKNGELKGWWIGLGPVEPAKKGGRFPWDKYPRAPLVLVKDKKDAAGFCWTTPEDEESR